RQRAHPVLTTTFHRVTKPRHGRKIWTSKRLKQIAITKTVSEGKLGTIGKIVIDSHIETIVVITQDGRRYEVCERHIPVRKWKECGDRAANGIDKEVGDGVVVKRHPAGKWTSAFSEDTLREIAVALQCCRHVCNARYTFARATAFIIGEEESAIVFDWSTERAAELIANVFGIGFGSGREEVTCVERSVAMKFERRTVEII